MDQAFRTLVVGLGVQGEKRCRHAGEDFVGAVDPVIAKAEWRELEEAPLDIYDVAILCTPDEPKARLIDYLTAHRKHVLVEKPLWAATAGDFDRLERQAREQRVAVRTAYNHRFEPHIARMREVIVSGELGRLYRCRLFYGNGTARQVRDSAWRDQGSGVLHDLGSHLLDIAAFWFDDEPDLWVISADRFENKAPDHVVLGGRVGGVRIELEMSLLSWRNSFTADIVGSRGAARIDSLCKWGPSRFTQRARVLPSGRPPEETVELVNDDPTWALEYADFKRFSAEVSLGAAQTSLAHDAALNATLSALGEQALAACRERASA